MTENRLKITLDFKKNRIRLYKAVLESLGMPKRLMFLIDPTDKILAVKAAPACTRSQDVTVSANFFSGVDSCDTYSKRLMGMIRRLCDYDAQDVSYTAEGHFEPKDRVVWFPIECKEVDHAAEI